MAPPNGQSSCALLAYLAADDRSDSSLLDGASCWEILKICSAAKRLNIPFAIQVDFKKEPLGVFRLSVVKRGDEQSDSKVKPWWLWTRLLDTFRNLKIDFSRLDSNEASKQTLVDFLAFALPACPADRHVLFFFGHSFGPMGMFYDARPQAPLVPSVLKISQLASGMKSAQQKIDLVIFRDCYMANLETAYQLRNRVKFMIASQGEIPIRGTWPWDDLMKLMADGDLRQAAHACASRMGDYFKEPENRILSKVRTLADVPLSLVDVDAVTSIADPFSSLVGALLSVRGGRNHSMKSTCADALENARTGLPNDTNHPGDPALVDVARLCAGLKHVDGDVGSSAGSVHTMLKNIICDSFSLTHEVHGLSLYNRPPNGAQSNIESRTQADDYPNLAFCKQTNWSDVAMFTF